MRRPRAAAPATGAPPRDASGSARPAQCALIGFAVVCALAVNARHMLRLHAAAAAEARAAPEACAPRRATPGPATRPGRASSTARGRRRRRRRCRRRPKRRRERAAAAPAEAEARRRGRGARGGRGRAAETPDGGRARGGRAARRERRDEARRGRTRGGGAAGGRTREEDARAVAAAVTRETPADAGPLRAADRATPAPAPCQRRVADRATPAPTPDRYEPRDRATPAPVAPPKKARRAPPRSTKYSVNSTRRAAHAEANALATGKAVPCRARRSQNNTWLGVRVLVTGLSRSGSTWQYNAVKSMLEQYVRRRNLPADEYEVRGAHADGDAAAFDACLSSRICVLKTHIFVPRLVNQVDVILTSHRDVRDVVLSSMLMFGACFAPTGSTRPNGVTASRCGSSSTRTGRPTSATTRSTSA